MRRLISYSTVTPFLLAFLLGGLLPVSPEHAFGMQTRVPAPAHARRRGLVGWEMVPAILARIKPPKFPARDFRITDYGARPSNDSNIVADNTAAIRKAIEACHASGGGRVVVPPGVWETGAIHLKTTSTSTYPRVRR